MACAGSDDAILSSQCLFRQTVELQRWFVGGMQLVSSLVVESSR